MAYYKIWQISGDKHETSTAVFRFTLRYLHEDIIASDVKFLRKSFVGPQLWGV